MMNGPLWLWFGLVVALALALYAAPWILVRYALAFLLLWVLPGLGWAALIPQRALRRPERLIVGLGLNFVVTPVTILLLTYIPGPLTQGQLLLGVVGAAALPVFLLPLTGWVDTMLSSPVTTLADEPLRPATPRYDLWHRLRRTGWLSFLPVLVLAAGLRGVNLDYSEFQGDEAIVMLSAARALQGDDGIVFSLKKGPAELLLVAGAWRLTGIINEWMARLPFTWASLVGLAGVFAFCRRLKERHLAPIVVGLLAVEGYLVAFGRIVQYQSMVFALTTLGLFCLLVFYQEGRPGLIVVSGAFLAGGLMAHQDALLVLPAGALFLIGRLGEDRRNRVPTIVSIGIALLLGLLLVAVFYVPFLQSPYREQTFSYLARRAGSGLHDNLRSTLMLSAVYDSIYYLVCLLLLWATTLLAEWARWGRIGLATGWFLLAVVVSTTFWPDLWTVGGLSLALVPLALLLLGALLAPGQPLPRRAVWLWLAVPCLTYLFVVADPRTHVHTFFTPWAILAGIGLVVLVRWLGTRSGIVRWSMAVAGLTLYLVFASYIVIMFVDHTPEYRRNFPSSQWPLFWTPYEQIPEQGLFGFPYRAGWKAAVVLIERGKLGENYSSNEEPMITKYYARQGVRWDCPSPELYATAAQVQDEVSIRWDQIQTDYQSAITVTVEGEPKLVIHCRAGGCLSNYLGKPVGGLPMTVESRDYDQVFDREMTPERVLPRPTQPKLTTPRVYEAADWTVGEFARLVGYRLDADQARPGGFVDLTIMWQVLATPNKDYTTFTHLTDGVSMCGQLDSAPGCGKHSTSGWRPTEIIVDLYRIPVRYNASPGLVPLTIGMYDSGTGERLPISGSDGRVLGDSLHLADVLIRPAPDQ